MIPHSALIARPVHPSESRRSLQLNTSGQRYTFGFFTCDVDKFVNCWPTGDENLEIVDICGVRQTHSDDEIGRWEASSADEDSEHVVWTAWTRFLTLSDEWRWCRIITCMINRPSRGISLKYAGGMLKEARSKAALFRTDQDHSAG